MPTVNIYFAHNIQLLRNFFGYEIVEVAKKIAVSPDRYRHWEQEKAYPSKPAFYVELCKLYRFTDLFVLFSKKLSDNDLHEYYNALDGTGGQ